MDNLKIMYFINGNNVREIVYIKEEYFRINGGKTHPYSDLTDYISEIVNKGWREVGLSTYLSKKYRK